MKQKLDLGRIKLSLMRPTDYFKEETPKKQIYLHHTVSHPSPTGDIRHWKSLSYRIGTCILVAGKPYDNDKGYVDGDIYQVFSSRYWAYHLASHFSGNQIPAKYKTRTNTRFLEKMAIGIEICNAGWLNWENGKFYSTFRTVVPEEEVIEYVDKYRHKRFYHKYTDAQIETVRQLLDYFCDKYDIPREYDAGMWDISENALSGKPGIYTHTSVRSDKTDCHPQPELVRMLMELNQPDTPPPTLANSASTQDIIENTTVSTASDELETDTDDEENN